MTVLFHRKICRLKLAPQPKDPNPIQFTQFAFLNSQARFLLYQFHADVALLDFHRFRHSQHCIHHNVPIFTPPEILIV